MKSAIISLTTLFLFSIANVQADVRLPASSVCLTFGQSTDLFEGEASPRRSRDGYFSLSMIEQAFDRPTYGALVLNNGIYRIGLTKNTNTASIAYQCDIPADSLNGQCNIMVFSALTATTNLMTDVGFLEFGRACTVIPGSSAHPVGEEY